jgi:hypothetical protein
MIALWGPPVPMTLQTPLGSIVLNDPTSADGYFIVQEESAMAPAVRLTQTNIPQQDGAILHRRWLTGVESTLVIELWQDAEQVACGELRQTMHDLFSGHARSLLRAGDNEGRLLWTPEGEVRRMLDDIRLTSYPVFTNDAGTLQVSVGIDTGYPYAIDLTQTEETVSGSGTLVNAGNAEFWPVIKVDGPFTTFEITNNDALDELGNPLTILYNGALPGAQSVPGGSYAEIDAFRGTIYLNGDGANLKPGWVATASDLFPIMPGSNDIDTDVSARFLLNNAWA